MVLGTAPVAAQILVARPWSTIVATGSRKSPYGTGAVPGARDRRRVRAGATHMPDNAKPRPATKKAKKVAAAQVALHPNAFYVLEGWSGGRAHPGKKTLNWSKGL